jgi:uncharacterized protein with HEPN domain
MREDDRVRVTHMIDAIESAIKFAKGRSRADIEGDQMLQFALVRAIEILGEAASKISAEGRSQEPDIPWGVIIGMRNRLVHAYFDIDSDIVWTTVTQSLSPLLPLLRALLEQKK